MAKKKTQMRIPGTFDPPPPEVAKAAIKFVGAKREKNKWLATEKAAHDTLVEAMVAHDCPEIEIDDGAKKIVLTEEQKAKIESVKKDRSSE